MYFFLEVSRPTVVRQNSWTYEMICMYVCKAFSLSLPCMETLLENYLIQTQENCTGPNQVHTTILDVLTMVFITVIVVLLLLF
jgi:hypothetical protein